MDNSKHFSRCMGRWLMALLLVMLTSLATRAAEAYANYTPSNKTLTFYYDNQRSSRSGTTYNLNTGSNYPGWFTDGTNSSVTKVVFDSSFAGARPTTTVNWFVGMTNLTTITGMKKYLNTSSVTDMHWMFSNCRGLTSLDLSGFNTARVRDMRYMFEGCSGLTILDVSGLNTAQVTNMASMFYNCRGLTFLDLGSFNTANVTNMAYMFEGCSGLSAIYAGSGWTTNAVTYSNGMFNNCTSLVGSKGTTYDASHTNATYARIDGGPNSPGYFTEWKEAYACYTSSNHTLTFYCDNYRSSRSGTTYDLNKGTDVPGWYEHYLDVTKVVFDPLFDYAHPLSSYCWFMSMRNLQSIEGISHLNTSWITDMSGMFEDCTSLRNLDLHGFNTSSVMNMMLMFEECTGLTSLDLSAFNTANVTNMQGMLANCSNLRTIYVSDKWNTQNVTSSIDMFTNCTSLVGGKGTTYNSNYVDKTRARIDGGPSNPGYFTEKGPEAYACYTPSNTTLTFYYDNLRSSRSGTTYGLNLGNEGMEWHETSYFFTQVVFDPSFADARPTTTSQWFEGMSNVRSITGLEYLNTESVTDMSKMFFDCRSLSSVDLSHFNTSNVTSMYFMFTECRALTSLDLSSFNTDNVTTMECMFLYCMGLTSVDLSGFTNARVSRTSNMFEGCNALTTIYADSGWNLPADNYSYAMFADCTSLVGGKGTTYDENHTDAAYAHIDGGPSNPGYFTEKAGGQRGDVNGDGSVNIADVTALIDLLLGSGTISNPAADCNQDGSVNIADVTTLIDYL